MADKKIKMTKEDAIAEYRLMWDWIVNEMEKTGIMKSPADYIQQFPEKSKKPLCDWVKQEYGSLICDKCPILWQTSVTVYGYEKPLKDCNDNLSPYNDFRLLALNPAIFSGLAGRSKASRKNIQQAQEMANMPAR